MAHDPAHITPLDHIRNHLIDDLKAVNTLIQTRMESQYAPRIPQVTAHLMGAGGKRIRPLLTLACAQVCGYDGLDHHKLAATVEFIHTATLLHDDVVDESHKRRGRPTANLLWDNKSSILVGDYLFARAFKLMVETKSLRVLDMLSGASAIIAEGEVLQLSSATNIATTQDTYLQVVRGKTAALFEAACAVGGVIANRPEAEITALARYGDGLGVAFQMVDDVLDWGGVSSQIGKNIGDDFRERKLTLPIIHAISKADRAEHAFWDRTIAKGQQGDDDLDHAQTLLARHNSLQYTSDLAQYWTHEAITALDALPDHALKPLLADLARHVVARLN
jgi:octaprenyl-diphosphate synthase